MSEAFDDKIVQFVDKTLVKDNTLDGNRTRKQSTKFDDYLSHNEIPHIKTRLIKKLKPKPIVKHNSSLKSTEQTMTAKKVISMAKKNSQLIPKHLTTKQKEELEREHSLIQNHLRLLSWYKESMQKFKRSEEEHWDVENLEATIKSLQQETSTLILNWTIPEAKIIGKLCKIFWKDEKNWYYCRVITYDYLQKKHLVSELALIAIEILFIHVHVYY
jgi:hypothetical protein